MGDKSLKIGGGCLTVVSWKIVEKDFEKRK